LKYAIQAKIVAYKAKFQNKVFAFAVYAEARKCALHTVQPSR